MRDEDSGEEIRCPYCDSTDECPHLLALIDRTFCTCSSGYCANRYHEFGGIVEAAFRERLQSGPTRKYSWNNSELNELWECAFDDYEGNEFVLIDGDILTRLTIELLDAAGGEQYPGQIDDDGGPGCSSALTLFYAKNSSAVLDAALAKLKKRLTSTTVAEAASVSRPSGRKSTARRS